LLGGGCESGDDVNYRNIGAAAPNAGDRLANNEGIHRRCSGSEGGADGEQQSGYK